MTHTVSGPALYLPAGAAAAGGAQTVCVQRPALLELVVVGLRGAWFLKRVLRLRSAGAWIAFLR